MDHGLGFSAGYGSAHFSEVLLFDLHFSIRVRRFGTFAREVVCRTKYRELVLTFPTSFTLWNWFRSIATAADESEYTAANCYESFSPPRAGSAVGFLHDGEEYFAAVHRAISDARTKVCLTDWWLTPDLPLLRPAAAHTGPTRIHDLVRSKAQEGVRFFIIVFAEMRQALSIDSGWTESLLNEQHPNIQVVRHGAGLNLFGDEEFAAEMEQGKKGEHIAYWSHHHKICIVDDLVGFVGGIDLCLGRFDTVGHPLRDDGPPDQQLFPGKDYQNPCLVDTGPVANGQSDADIAGLNRTKAPRMPRHDASVCLQGAVVADLGRHFAQLWTHASRHRWQSGQDLDRLTLATANALSGRVGGVDPRVYLSEDSTVVGQTPRTTTDTRPQPTRLLRVMPENGIVAEDCEVQMCRSVGHWSLGLDTEHSIQNAYLDLISSAKHYLYIENQFFVSNPLTKPQQAAASASHLGVLGHVRNRIAQEIVKRILVADKEQRPFRVYVVLPVMPGEKCDDPSQPGTYPCRAIINANLATMCRGRYSIVGRLKEAGVDPSKYIGFYSLRRTQLFEDDFRVQQIYVHSKILVVDDETVLIGSANLNDRSQMGNRDAEVAVVIRDRKYVEGAPLPTAKGFAFRMRMALWQEHCGPGPLDDPSSDACWEFWRKLAAANSELYRTLGVYPDNTQRTYESVRQFFGISNSTISMANSAATTTLGGFARIVTGVGKLGLGTVASGVGVAVASVSGTAQAIKDPQRAHVHAATVAKAGLSAVRNVLADSVSAATTVVQTTVSSAVAAGKVVHHVTNSLWWTEEEHQKQARDPNSLDELLHWAESPSSRLVEHPLDFLADENLLYPEPPIGLPHTIFV